MSFISFLNFLNERFGFGLFGVWFSSLSVWLGPAASCVVFAVVGLWRALPCLSRAVLSCLVSTCCSTVCWKGLAELLHAFLELCLADTCGSWVRCVLHWSPCLSITSTQYELKLLCWVLKYVHVRTNTSFFSKFFQLTRLLPLCIKFRLTCLHV